MVKKGHRAGGKDEAAGKDAQAELLVLGLRRGMERRRYSRATCTRADSATTLEQVVGVYASWPLGTILVQEVAWVLNDHRPSKYKEGHHEAPTIPPVLPKKGG